MISRSIPLVLERQAPGHVTALMQDTLSDIISLQFNKHSDYRLKNTFYNLPDKRSHLRSSANVLTKFHYAGHFTT
jgi:hypothetical protein